MSLQVNLEQPEEWMLRQKQSHTQGQKLPALKNNVKLSPDTPHTRHKHKRAGSLRAQHALLLPPCGEDANLQGSWVAVRLPPAGLLDELAEELVLKLGVGQTHLQGTLGQRNVVVDGWSVDGHVDEQLTGLRREATEREGRDGTSCVCLCVCLCTLKSLTASVCRACEGSVVSGDDRASLLKHRVGCLQLWAPERQRV